MEIFRFLVAVGAGDGNMATVKGETSFLVLHQGEGGRLIAFQVVALVASIEVRSGDKLASVPVPVTIGALGKFHLIQGVFPFGDVALGTFQPRMTALQWILRGSVFLHCEQGRLPALHFVTGGTLTAIRTFGELSIVSVFVAVGTFGERDLFLEISVGVALGALDLRVLSLKWILRFRVVEALAYVLQRSLLPTGRGVARRTGLREAAMMRVRMTI